MAWHRLHMLPLGASTSRTWSARHDDGRAGLLREVADGVTANGGATTPGLVPLLEVVELDGRRYSVWPLLEGRSLQELLEGFATDERRPPLGLLARIVVDAARALIGVTPSRPHGGLSDGALLLTRDGTVQVMDFGAPRPSRFTLTGAPSFVSDVFALGAVLHAALTGFGGSYADAIAEGLPLPPPSQHHDECTPAVDDVIQRAIARSVEARQPDLELLADELEAVLGDQLFTADQLRAFLHEADRPGPPVPDVDPGPAPGIDDVPTGQHFSPGTSETMPGLEPVKERIPSGTQPGTPPADAFAALGPADTQPQPALTSTQPGFPNPILTNTQPGFPNPVLHAPPPTETVPGAFLPTAVLAADTRENEVPTGPRAVPPVASTSVSAAKLEWAQGQTRVPTPPLGVPATKRPASTDEHDVEALGHDPESTGVRPIPATKAASSTGDDDPYGHDPESTELRPLSETGDDADSTGVRPIPATRPAGPVNTSGTAPLLPSVGTLDEVARSSPELPSSSATRKVIAALLVVVAGVFAAVVWKLQAQPTTLAKVIPVVLDVDAGVTAPTPPAEPAPLVDDDAGAALDEGEDTPDAGEDEDEDAGVVSAAAPDAQVKAPKPPVKKKKPTKKKRHR